MNNRVGLVFGLLLVLSAISCLNINTVFAAEVIIDSIVPWTNGADTMLNITATHTYNQLNYAQSVEVEIDEISHTIPCADLNEMADTFVVQYNMGEVTGTPTVRARGHCSVMGAGEWTEPIVIPEFSIIHLLPILIAVSIATLLVRLKISKKLMQ